MIVEKMRLMDLDERFLTGFLAIFISIFETCEGIQMPLP